MTIDKIDPLYRRIREHAEKRLLFDAGSSSGDRLPKLKEYMRLEREMLLRYQRKGDRGTRVAKARSIMLDVLLEKLFQFALEAYYKQHGPPPCEVALVALGGYGREEVCPYSDVDLMFLFPKKSKKKLIEPLQTTLADEILYPLWDLGLKVGHSTRTSREAIEEAKADDQTKNALTEARLICGSNEVYLEFEKAFRSLTKNEKPGPYVKQRLNDQKARREKYGGTVFMQEPDIKNGVGGMRDYQSILWMAHVRLGVGSLIELERKEYLTEADRKLLEKAYDFLMRVRIELHFQSNRATDVINLEKQPLVAWALGYKQRDVFKRVEAFMRDYYRHAQRIYLISTRLEQRLAVASLAGPSKIPFRAVIESRRADLQRYIDGFILNKGVFYSEHNKIFEEDPVRLLRIFRYLQQHEGSLDVELRILISDSINLLTPKVARQEAAKRCFRSILQSTGQVYDALQPMHELGVLGRFLPEFEGITCLVQHEYYHRYTADIHTLETIRILDQVITGDIPGTQHYQKALHDTEIPALLYLMLLLHDIGKGESIKNHQKIGTQLSKAVIKRLDVEKPLWEEILWIVENHLEMARFWQRLDVHDPDTVSSLTQFVGEEDRLRYLYVLTYCDTCGTSASLWNSYKESLHTTLFNNALAQLHGDQKSIRKKSEERKEMIHRDIIKQRLPDLAEDQVEAHFSLLPERYFIHNSTEEVILHLKMINQMLVTISESDSVGSLVPMIDWRDDHDQGFTVVNVITWDRAGLFYKLAGALTVAGVNILSTKAISRSDHITIDTFYIVSPSGGIVESKRAEPTFRKSLSDALLEGKDLMPDILAQAKQVSNSIAFPQNTRLQAPIPSTVDVYHELSLKRTIVEVQANDHLGLLYQLAKAIFDHGYNITFARISTERDAALDTFYIENINETDSDTTRLLSLREDLTKIVAQEDIRAAG
ncbi:[protein-PII] uridylyltransferase [Rubellicoccus peritrichatus]|uniref:Bifunctional uridylyltransferase/uridylyl-removing enzyme n=1 Tax=Rubellicoccus peritrichatus TaxID=3080537 RepID=A0AAQ3QT64_9BACT|nr:[protein-PII] uridylyltransferase [Puniceicoccus sp. CR14]WOO43358.1 [protein-PII] uridylyltransferase [Puniceicoccus sp. CR14]